MNKVLVLVGSIFAPIGLIFAAVGGWLYLQDRNSARDSVAAVGTVIDLASARDSDGTYSYRPIVRFDDSSGRPVTITARVGSSTSGYSRGEAVPVLYNPASPENAIIDSFFQRYFLMLIFGGIGTVFAALGGSLLYICVRRRRTIARLIKTGLPLQAQFIESYRDTGLTLNGRNPFRVICQAANPETGKLRSFKSDPVWVDLSARLAGREVRVLIDPANPKHYYVDLSPYLDDSETG